MQWAPDVSRARDGGEVSKPSNPTQPPELTEPATPTQPPKPAEPRGRGRGG